MGDRDPRPLHYLDPGTAEFSEHLLDLSRAPRLAFDTESDPFHRYYEKVCLLQFSTESADYFLDPLTHGMPDPIRALLSDASRTLVIHGADYDVRSLKHSFQLRLGKVVDTSIAAQLLGLPLIGLKNLLEGELGIVIDKKEQRSDWGQRPLTRAQLDYARQDTRDLLALAARLESRLQDLGRYAWLEEECALLLDRELKARTFDPEGFRKIKGSKALGIKGTGALRALYGWREQRAMAEDVPPFRVIRNELLLALAQLADRGPLTPADLKSIKGVPKWIDHRVLLEVMARGISESPPRPVSGSRPARPSAEVQKRTDKLRAARIEWAQALAIDPGVLLPSSALERIAELPPQQLEKLHEVQGLTRWRAELLAPRILQALAL